MTTLKRSWIQLPLIALAGLLIVLGFVLAPSPSGPPITWTPAAITETIPAGTGHTVSVSFVSSQNFSNVDVRVVPALQPYVQVSPTTFANLIAGQTYTVDLTLSAPDTATPGAIDGVIQLRRNGQNTIARPLAVTSSILSTTATSIVQNGVAVSFVHPSDWATYSNSPDEVVLDGPTTTNALADGDQEISPDIVIRLLENPAGLSAADFAEDDENGWYSSYEDRTDLTVNGHDAVFFSDAHAQLPHKPELAAYVTAGSQMVVIVGHAMSINTFNVILGSLQFP